MSKISTIRGRAAEYRAKKYLEQKGLHFITANYRSRHGEIDLIMSDQAVLVFVEVRCRKNDHYGKALESLSQSKIDNIIATAEYYLSAISPYGEDTNVRFDIVAYNHGLSQPPCWIRNAFDDEKSYF